MRLFNPFAVWSQVPLANRTVRTGDYAEYACTVANAVGTGGSAPTSDVTVVTWTVPANTWLDGQSIIVRIGSLNKFSWTANGNARYLNFKMSATGAAVAVSAKLAATAPVASSITPAPAGRSTGAGCAPPSRSPSAIRVSARNISTRDLTCSPTCRCSFLRR